MNNQKISAAFLAVLSVIFWGITFVCTKYLLRSFSSIEILFIRFVIAWAGLWILYPKTFKPDCLKHELYFAFAGLMGVTCYQYVENIAINYTAAGNVSVIVSTSPFFCAIAAQLILKEKQLSFRFLLGFVIAIFGIALVSFKGTESVHINPKGDLLAFGSAASWGIYSVFLSKINKLGYKSLPVTRRTFFYAVIYIFILVLINYFTGSKGNGRVSFAFAENAERFSDMWNWIDLLFLGVVASLFCFVAWAKASKILGMIHTSVLLYLIPVVTIIFAYLFLGEKLTLASGLGVVLTVLGLFISRKVE